MAHTASVPPVVATSTIAFQVPAQTRPGNALHTSMIPGCCGLKTIHKLNCLGNDDDLSAKYAKEFDKLVEDGKAMDGNWNTYGKAVETVLVITDSPRYTKPEEFERQVKFLKAHGFHEICSWKSLEGSLTKKSARNYMWGSKGIATTEEEK